MVRETQKRKRRRRSNVAAARSNPGLYLEAFSSPAGNKDDTTVPKAALGGRYQRERDSTCCTQPHRVDYPQAWSRSTAKNATATTAGVTERTYSGNPAVACRIVPNEPRELATPRRQAQPGEVSELTAWLGRTPIRSIA